MPLGVGKHRVTVAIPYLSLLDGPIAWWKIDFWSIYDTGFGDSYPETLDKIALASALHPMWRKNGWTAKTQTFTLSEGVNNIPFVNLLRVRFHLTSEQQAIDRNWMPTNHGIWGTIRGVILGSKSISHDIKDSEHIHVFRPGEYAGVEATLKPGVTGTIDCTPWTGVPPIQYALDGGSFVPWNTTTPYYANPLPPVL